MLIYKNRNTFLQRLHPLTGFLLITAYISGILIIKNPVYVAVIIISIYLLSAVDGCSRDIKKYTLFVLPAAVFIIILNPLLNHNGDTLLLRTAPVPVIGSIRITLEALMYGIILSIKLIGITAAFGFGNLILHPDRTFSFFSKYMGNSALLMNMTLRLFPTIFKSLNNIIEVEKLRGNKVFDKNIKRSIKNQSNIVNILFMTCLEDAADMAESMHSRGYGIGKRNVYFHESFSNYDRIFNGIFIAMLFVFAAIQYYGMNSLNIYPVFENVFRNVTVFGIIFSLLFYIPAIINWGWEKWL